MLVLSRQRDESIVIGDNIVITIVDIRGDKVRLGIEAPREVPVHRQEVYDAIQRERTPDYNEEQPNQQDTNSDLENKANDQDVGGGTNPDVKQYPMLSYC